MDAEHVAAELKEGVLTLGIAKKPEVKAKEIEPKTITSGEKAPAWRGPDEHEGRGPPAREVAGPPHRSMAPARERRAGSLPVSSSAGAIAAPRELRRAPPPGAS